MRHHRRKKSSFIKDMFKLLLVMAVCYLAGFIYFVKSMPFSRDELRPTNDYDAIIVFTGEGERIAEGLKLYYNKVSKNLFISGVFRDLPIKYFFKMKNDEADFDKLDTIGIDYDNFAKNTIDNIVSTKLYTNTESFDKIILISSFYHIPRVKFLMTRFASNLEVVYHPVFPRNISRSILDEEFLKISLLEYNKILTYIIWEILGIENENLKD